jgi:hypothetical protein
MTVYLLSLAGSVWAQTPGPGQFRLLAEQVGAAHSITCWYDESGTLTGATQAAPGAGVGTKIKGESGGAHSWGYTVAGHDSSVCPAKLPVSTLTQ